MSNNVKKMDIKEFRQLGYLQEINRQFLHPLGLALEITVDNETGDEFLGGIWDYRNDPEGMIYNFAESQLQRIQEAEQKANNIAERQREAVTKRHEQLGYYIEPIQRSTDDQSS